MSKPNGSLEDAPHHHHHQKKQNKPKQNKHPNHGAHSALYSFEGMTVIDQWSLLVCREWIQWNDCSKVSTSDINTDNRKTNTAVLKVKYSSLMAEDTCRIQLSTVLTLKDCNQDKKKIFHFKQTSSSHSGVSAQHAWLHCFYTSAYEGRSRWFIISYGNMCDDWVIWEKKKRASQEGLSLWQPRHDKQKQIAMSITVKEECHRRLQAKWNVPQEQLTMKQK